MVSFCISLVSLIQRFFICVQRITVCHIKFTTPHNTITWTNFITVFCINLICVNRKLFVRSKTLAHNCSVSFFCSWAYNHILITTVFSFKHLWSHCVPSSAFLPNFTWNNYSWFKFLGTDVVPFFFNNRFNFTVCLQSQWHISIKTVTKLADKVCSHHQLMA